VLKIAVIYESLVLYYFSKLLNLLIPWKKVGYLGTIGQKSMYDCTKTEDTMAQTRDWKGMKDMSTRLLKERSGEDLHTWNQRIKAEGLKDEQSLRRWLSERGVTGYAQGLLVMEQFGYPDFYLATADELIEGQYADRKHLRPIFNAILEAAVGLG
jgi:hypothetical protein